MSSVLKLYRLSAKGPRAVIVTLIVVMLTALMTAGASAQAPKKGGSLTVLEGAALVGGYPAGLDPGQRALTTSGPMMDAIYGDLFELGPGNKVIDDLATGYKLTMTTRRSPCTCGRE